MVLMMALIVLHQIEAGDGFYGGGLGYGRSPFQAYGRYGGFGPGRGLIARPGLLFPRFGNICYRGINFGRGRGLGFGGFPFVGGNGYGFGPGFLG